MARQIAPRGPRSRGSLFRQLCSLRPSVRLIRACICTYRETLRPNIRGSPARAVMLGSLSFHAPPLSGERGRARVQGDSFRDRARRSHAGQYLYGISRGAVPSCSVSLSFHAPPLSGERGRARVPDDAFRDRARRSHAGQSLYGISRGAVPSCSVSLSFPAPPLSGERGRARVPGDAFRDRARRSHAGQYLYGISRGAVPRRNRKARPAPAIGRFLPTAKTKNPVALGNGVVSIPLSFTAG